MGLFDFFKKDNKQEKVTHNEKYWSLSTNADEVTDPSWEQVERAVKNAVPDRDMFASLGYINSGLEIESIQAVGEDGVYRLEALPPQSSYDYGKIFINDSISYAETVELFKEFYDHQRVIGYRSWETMKI